MIVDSSVVLALLFGESRADEAARLLNENRDALHQSSVNAAEILMRLRSQVSAFHLARALRTYEAMPITVLPADYAQAQIAAEARLRYPRLNFGDCFTYAAARTTGLPILTFDADFAGVDVEVVGL